MKNLSWTIAAIALVSLASSAVAGTRTLDVAATDFIVSPQGAGRILVKFPALAGLENVAVAQARLRIPVPAIAPEEGLEIQVHPILRDWTPGAVTWTTGWERPGGDFQDGIYGRASFRSADGRSTSDIDVTTIVLEIQDGTPTYGLLLTAAPHRGEGFDELNRDRLVQALEGAQLEIRYRNRSLPARLRRG